MREIDLMENTLQVSQEDAARLQNTPVGQRIDMNVAGKRLRVRVLPSPEKRRPCDYCTLNPKTKGEGIVICEYWRLCYANQRPDGNSVRFITTKRIKKNGEQE